MVSTSIHGISFRLGGVISRGNAPFVHILWKPTDLCHRRSTGVMSVRFELCAFETQTTLDQPSSCVCGLCCWRCVGKREYKYLGVRHSSNLANLGQLCWCHAQTAMAMFLLQACPGPPARRCQGQLGQCQGGVFEHVEGVGRARCIRTRYTYCLVLI